MVEVLQNSEDPKHRNSEFLKFLKQLNSGALNIEDGKLVENQTKMTEFAEQEKVRIAADLVRQKEAEQFRIEHEEHLRKLREQDEDLDEIQDEHTEHKDLFKDIDEDLTETQFDKMMEQWKQEGGNQPGMKDMMGEWGKLWEDEAAQQFQGIQQ